jgi:phage-related protein
MAEKPVVWLGSALDDLRGFPEEARRSAGHEIHLVQMGLEPSDWKPMSSVGPGVMELRIHSQLEHRVFYIAKFAEAVFVIHAFQKKTRKTAKHDIDLAKHRLAELIRRRSKR